MIDSPRNLLAKIKKQLFYVTF
uniref:Uncharacterized protein n=1 Tax=Tetranychus urticae TaxID=32264 RepID=T1KYL4_TETUR